VELGWTSAGAHGPEKGAAGAGGRSRWGNLFLIVVNGQNVQYPVR